MTVTKRALPAFAALRAFEAVGRTLHFTRAAEELGVTQAAVSRQVKALEAELGTTLILRHPVGNALTNEGAVLLEAIRSGLDRMARGVEAVRPAPRRRRLTVSVAPFFSAVWLTPRLAGFARCHPGIDVRLHHSYEPPDYARDQIDLGINWGRGDWPGVLAEKFLDGSMVPICNRRVAKTLGSRPRPRVLLDMPLYYEFAAEDWVAWFAAVGARVDAEGLRATRIDDTHALVRTAIEQDCVALVIRSVVVDLLRSGQVAQPFPQAADVGRHYFLARPRSGRESEESRAFRRWLWRENAGPS